jgi:ribosomal protein S18 acetylase RimI-like enzyme
MIRPVSPDELDTCAAVIRRSFLTVAEEFGLTEQTVPTNGAFIRTERLQREYQNGLLMLGFYQEGSLAGIVQLEPKENGLWVLEKLSVLPECRHRGYGRELVAFCREKVEALGGSLISIGIIEENTRLKNWYLSLGFQHTGTRTFSHLPFTVGFMEMQIRAREAGMKTGESA